MEALTLKATIKKHVNVMDHLVGHVKKKLAPLQNSELHQTIEDYHRGFVPLVVPLTLIAHYVRLLDIPYLKNQVYLNPHPKELMLRNHV